MSLHALADISAKTAGGEISKEVPGLDYMTKSSKGKHGYGKEAPISEKVPASSSKKGKEVWWSLSSRD